MQGGHLERSPAITGRESPSCSEVLAKPNPRWPTLSAAAWEAAGVSSVKIAELSQIKCLFEVTKFCYTAIYNWSTPHHPFRGRNNKDYNYYKRKMEKIQNKWGDRESNKPRTLDTKSGIWPWGERSTLCSLTVCVVYHVCTHKTKRFGKSTTVLLYY